MRALPRLFALALVLFASTSRAQVPTPAEEARWDRAFNTVTPLSGGYGAAEYPDGRILMVGYRGTVQTGAGVVWIGDRWTDLPALSASGSPSITTTASTPVITDDGRAFVVVGASNSTGATVNEWTGTVRIPQPGITGGASMRLVRGPQGRACVVGSIGAERAGRVLCFDGAAWTQLGGTAAGENAFLNGAATGPDGRMYVTGDFTSMGGAAARNVAVWDGSAWQAVGDGTPLATIDRNRQGFRVAVSGAGRVLVTTRQGNSLHPYRLWAFDGGAWTEIPTGDAYSGDVLSAGPGGAVFTVDVTGTGPYRTLMRVDGRALTAISAGSGGTVYALERARNGDLFVLTDAPGFGNLSARGMVRYDGTAFRAYGDGLTGDGIPNFDVMAPRGAGVCVGGDIQTAGGLIQRRRLGSTLSPYGIACWDGARWDTLATPIPNGATRAEVGVLVSDPAGRLYLSTSIEQNGVTQGAGVFRYDAGAWTRLGGLFQGVSKLAISSDGSALYVFGKPAGASAFAVQRWTGSAWADVGAINAQSASDLAVTGDGTVWASGSIPIGGQNATLARFNGTAWQAPPVPAGTTLSYIGRPILAGPGSSLLAGGVEFYDARFQLAFSAKVARLDGTTWTKLGDAPFTTVNLYALAQDGRGNVFASATGPSGEGLARNTVYRYDAGAGTWARLTTGFGPVNGSQPSSLLYTNGALYAAGDFQTVGATPAQGFARWSDPRGVATEDAPSAPGSGSLRVFPNPAHGRATAVFTLSEPQTVRATLVDVTGREIALVHVGELPAGEARLSVPLAGLAAGVYIVRVEGADVHAARALVVAR